MGRRGKSFARRVAQHGHELVTRRSLTSHLVHRRTQLVEVGRLGVLAQRRDDTLEGGGGEHVQ